MKYLKCYFKNTKYQTKLVVIPTNLANRTHTRTYVIGILSTKTSLQTLTEVVPNNEQRHPHFLKNSGTGFHGQPLYKNVWSTPNRMRLVALAKPRMSNIVNIKDQSIS